MESEMLCVSDFANSLAWSAFFGVEAKKVGPPPWRTQKNSLRPDGGRKKTPSALFLASLARQLFFGEGPKKSGLILLK
jgi:hypothetical protein